MKFNGTDNIIKIIFIYTSFAPNLSVTALAYYTLLNPTLWRKSGDGRHMSVVEE
jgi:hypothetical protein